MEVDGENINTLHIVALPDEILENVLSFLLYDEISGVRRVCKKFDKCCQRLLNQGFIRAEKFHARCIKSVKSQLPRRESERRHHPLARHCDILNSIETRLSLLGMTFMKYMDMSLCCFIPGKVIDEIFRVLRFLQIETAPPRAHEILQELRDISSMAIEHFDERIAPILKQRIGNMGPSISVSQHGTFAVPSLNILGNVNLSGIARPINRGLTLKCEIAKFQQCVKQLTATNAAFKKELNDCKSKVSEQKAKILEQEKCIMEQSRILADQGVRIAEQEGKLNEVNRKLLEYDRQFLDLMAEISCIREEAQLKAQDMETVLTTSQDKVATRSMTTKFNSLKRSAISTLESVGTKRRKRHTEKVLVRKQVK